MITVSIQETAEIDFTFEINDLNVVFENSNNYGATAFAWTFGDNSFTSVPNPGHNYDDYGIYEVCVLASSACGDKETCSSHAVHKLHDGSHLKRRERKKEQKTGHHHCPYKEWQTHPCHPPAAKINNRRDKVYRSKER